MRGHNSNIVLTYQNLGTTWFKYSQLLSSKTEDEQGIADGIVCFLRGTSSEKIQKQVEEDAATAENFFKKGDFLRLALLLSNMSKTYHGVLADESEKFANLLLSPLCVFSGQKQYFRWLRSNLSLAPDARMHNGIRALYKVYANYIDTLEASSSEDANLSIDDLIDMPMSFEMVLPLKNYSDYLHRVGTLSPNPEIKKPEVPQQTTLPLNNAPKISWKSAGSKGYPNTIFSKLLKDLPCQTPQPTQTNVVVAPLQNSMPLVSPTISVPF